MGIKKTAASFAHLLGISAKKAEEDEDKKRDGESDDEYAKRMEEKQEEEDAKKAEEDEEARRAEEEKEEEEKARKAKKAEEDEDDKEKAARKSERARCRAIFAAASAGSRPDMAAHLAFDTGMSSDEAVALLNVAASGSSARAGLGNRMASVSLPKVGTDGDSVQGANSASGVAAQIITAGKKRRGEV
jgi:flagellar biosynthesis GTPase FlhF